MSDPLIYVGPFPDDPEVPVADETKRWIGAFALQGPERDMSSGELNYHPCDGIFVRVLDWVGAEPILGRDADRKYPALNGLIEGTRHCTVVNAFETNVGGGRYELSHIVGNALLLDGFCDDPAAPAFRRMRFGSSAFTAIANPRGIKVEHVKGRKRAKVVAEVRKATEAPWGAHKLVLSSTIDGIKGQAWDGTMSLAERPYLEIHFAEVVSLNEILRITAALEFLSCVGDGVFSGPPDVQIWSDPVPPKRRRGRQLRIVRPPVTLMISQGWYRASEARHPIRRTLLLDAIAEEPLPVVARWLDLSRKIERLEALFRAALEAPNVETKFLFLIQAVEGLHRALDHRLGIDKDEFAKAVVALEAALPADLSREAREYLKPRLPQHNEPSLNARLKEYGERVTALFPNALPKFSKDRRAITELRNEFSHQLPTEPPVVVEEYGRRLLYYSDLLRTLFEFCLLRHLDLDPARLRNAFERTGVFEKLAREREELLGGAN